MACNNNANLMPTAGPVIAISKHVPGSGPRLAIILQIQCQQLARGLQYQNPCQVVAWEMQVFYLWGFIREDTYIRLRA